MFSLPQPWARTLRDLREEALSPSREDRLVSKGLRIGTRELGVGGWSPPHLGHIPSLRPLLEEEERVCEGPQREELRSV